MKALIIGASKGIGRALVDELLSHNVEVCAVSRHTSLLANESNLLCINVDVTNDKDVASMIRFLNEKKFYPDVVYLNAGVYDSATLGQFDTEFVKENIEINYKGIVNCLFSMLSFLPANQSCQFVFSSSVMSLFPFPGNAIYSANKAAINHLFKALSFNEEFERHKFKIVYFGPVQTGINKKATYKKVEKETPKEAAGFLYSIIDGSKTEYYFPFKARLFNWACNLLPLSVFRFLLAKVAGGKV